jgi:hypothetical protein
MPKNVFALLCLLPFAHYILVASDNKPISDGQKSHNEFRATIKSFPYSASTVRKIRIVKNYPSLRVGMDKKQVSALIGDPDYSEVDFGPKGPREHWLGSSWNYQLFMRADTINLNDPKIEIFFGTDGLLFWAVPSGISGLSEIGKCCKDSK